MIAKSGGDCNRFVVDDVNLVWNDRIGGRQTV